MHRIDWLGNDGQANPVPGTVETIECGICGTQMNVERNVLRATSIAERMAGTKHRHDHFTCPNLREGWHKRIYRLKTDVYNEEMNIAMNYREKKNAIGKEILKILKTHVVR